MEKELEEYCHDVADKRKDIEDLILRRELQDAWSAHDRQCTAYGDGLTPAMRHTATGAATVESNRWGVLRGLCLVHAGCSCQQKDARRRTAGIATRSWYSTDGRAAGSEAS